MDKPLTLARRIDFDAAQKRFKRLGAQRFEPVWVPLWAFALGTAPQTPCAWLLASLTLRRPMLLTSVMLASQQARPAGELALEGGEAPAADAVTRQWFWERMANPRRWKVQLLEDPPKPLWLPCWLGYSKGRQHRVIVLSGLSGETLPVLKPAILDGLERAARQNPRGEPLLEKEKMKSEG
ncbi:hypothetical protein [Vreelandella sp. EE27]